MKQKTLREDRTAAAGKYVACATRRRRRILRAGFFFTFLVKKWRFDINFDSNGKAMQPKKNKIEFDKAELDGNGLWAQWFYK